MNFSNKQCLVMFLLNKKTIAFSKTKIVTHNKPLTDQFVRLLPKAECLNLHWCDSLAEARRLIEDWRRDYNVSRPRMALGDITPAEFVLQTRDSHARVEKSAVGF